MTNGNVKRINPDELKNDFAVILEDELVATNVIFSEANCDCY